MKPILIIPPDEMSDEDKERLRENGVCVVEAKHPESIRFTEPPIEQPADRITGAALSLTRFVVSHTGNFGCHDLAKYWARCLLEGTTIEEQRTPKTERVKK